MEPAGGFAGEEFLLKERGAWSEEQGAKTKERRVKEKGREKGFMNPKNSTNNLGPNRSWFFPLAFNSMLYAPCSLLHPPCEVP
jgi:hypothetical protein